jgi:DNA-binding MarR family transcriptional regulator
MSTTHADQTLSFLLSQVGVHLAFSFHDDLADLGLQNPHVGILQLVARAPGNSQQALARKIGIPPNRLVALIDDLEQRGLIRRERLESDRRVFALHVTPEGERMLGEVAARVARREKRLFASLSADERETLAALLRKIAEDQQLEPGVHPAFRKLR